MPNELSETLKNAGTQITQYIKDASELKVQTFYKNIDEPHTEPILGAQTIIRLDGDCQTYVPTSKSQQGLTVESAIFNVHDANVKAAIEYRAKLMHTFIELLQSTRK